MKAKTKTVIQWVAVALSFVLAVGSLTTFILYQTMIRRGRTYEVSATVAEGSKIYTPQLGSGMHYRYGPTMMYDESDKLEMWFSSPPETAEYSYCWDVLRYRSTSDYGKTFSDEYISLAPLNGSEETLSVCDPGVIFLDGWYYMLYTSTIETQGRYNNVYTARARTPDGEWERWNGKGWGGTVVKPVITYGSNAEHYGIGEPSVVIVDGKMYVYYTYKGPLGNGTVVNQTRLSIADANENWPLTLREYGVVVGDKASDEDSLDVKYIPQYDMFVGITTAKRMTKRAHLKLYYAYDGKNFREGEIDDTAAKEYLHNVGISGDRNGHIDLDKPQFVSYAYSDGDEFTWGNWCTEFHAITFDFKKIFDADKAREKRTVCEPSFPDGKAPSAWAMSEASEYRTAYDAIDDDPTTFYSSVGHNVTGINEWHTGKWYHESLAVTNTGRSASRMTVTPRASNGGPVYGFPKAFMLQYSSDGVLWHTIKEYADYTPESDAPITFSFGRKIKAKYFRMVATELGADEFGTYIFQIAEISVK